MFQTKVDEIGCQEVFKMIEKLWGVSLSKNFVKDYYNQSNPSFNY